MYMTVKHHYSGSTRSFISLWIYIYIYILPRPHRPDRVITDNYLPPRGSEPPRVEVSVPGPEEVKDILCRWEPFHRGASAADRLDNLYQHIY